jgi:hypothetical protein
MEKYVRENFPNTPSTPFLVSGKIFFGGGPNYLFTLQLKEFFHLRK